MANSNMDLDLMGTFMTLLRKDLRRRELDPGTIPLGLALMATSMILFNKKVSVCMISD